MILLWLILIPIIGGALAWAGGRRGDWPRWTGITTCAAGLVVSLYLWISSGARLQLAQGGPWLAEFNREWIPQLGIRFHFAVDGLSLPLIALTFFVGLLAVAASWTEIQEAVGFFHLNLLWVLAGVVGVFLALDLFLFYFAWELMLIPMYFLIAIWGHENRRYASVKFFIFTQLSSLMMLVAIISLAIIHQRVAGFYSFAYADLLSLPLATGTAAWLMLGFFIAFAVKLPMFPFHTWLPDAHTEAPTAGSVVLAALLLKTGAYGLIRFVVPLFPDAAREFAPVAIALGVVGILYGAILAFAQTDLKRLVAYTSVSHLGFVLVGVFIWNELALQGALITMLAHGISTGALFILVGALQERMHTRDLDQMGGLWSTIPRLGGATMLFAMASLGLPGLGDFVGEFLVLLGAFRAHPVAAVAATIGVLIATMYALRIIQRPFHGPNSHVWRLPDFSPREFATIGVMAAVLIWIGLYPQPILRIAAPVFRTLEQGMPQRVEAAPQTLDPPLQALKVPSGGER